MLQEYLFLNTENQKTVKDYKPKEASVRYIQWEKSDSWCVQYEISGENENVAKQLSEIHCYVMEHYKPTVLTNDSASYFNKRLYPLISEFERKLRKLLYVSSALHPNADSAKNISNLEAKDFGTIFAFLFVDEGFMKTAKDEVRNKNKDAFTKAEILKLISELDEDTLWGSLLGNETVPTLQKDFTTVRSYRNDVMHSHDIDWEKYNLSKKLYTIINKEMDAAISMTFESAKTQPMSDTFNGTLKNAIDRLDISDTIQTLTDLISNCYQNTEYQQWKQIVEMITEALKPTSEVQRAIKMIQELQEPRKKFISPEIQTKLDWLIQQKQSKEGQADSINDEDAC